MKNVLVSFGMGLSLLLSAGLTAQEPNLIVNGSFEELEDTTTGHQPDTTGDWAGDVTEIIEAENGIVPPDGIRMLRFIQTTGTIGSSTTGSDLWQSIDVTASRDAIDAGLAICSARASFNRVHVDATTDTLFAMQVYAFSGSPASFRQQVIDATYLTVLTDLVFTDADPATWEDANLEFVLPAGTDFLGVLVAAVENVSNDGAGVEFHGHYVDAVSVSVDDGNQGPSCQSDPGPHVAVVGESFSHSVQGTDPDGDALELSFDFTPPGATWTPPAGTVAASPVDVSFDWTPSSDDVGQWDLAVSFTDPLGELASCPFSVIVNHRPEARIAFERLPDMDGLSHFALDGSDSSDADHVFEELSFAWTIVDNANGSIVLELAGATHDDVALVHGDYTATLLVTDPLGTAGEASVALELEPLVDVAIRRAQVDWELGEIVMSGSIALPDEIDRASLDPSVALNLTLADRDVFTGQLDNMDVGSGLWIFTSTVEIGLTNFAVRWEDASYSLSPEGFPILIRGEDRSHFEILVSSRLSTEVTVDFDGRATVTLAPNGNNSSSGEVEINSSRRGKLVSVDLGFEMALDSTVTVSDDVNSLTRTFGDDWTPDKGALYVRALFDLSDFPEGLQTLPRTLDLGMVLGTDGPIGISLNDLEISANTWVLPAN